MYWVAIAFFVIYGGVVAKLCYDTQKLEGASNYETL